MGFCPDLSISIHYFPPPPRSARARAAAPAPAIPPQAPRTDFESGWRLAGQERDGPARPRRNDRGSGLAGGRRGGRSGCLAGERWRVVVQFFKLYHYPMETWVVFMGMIGLHEEMRLRAAEPVRKISFSRLRARPPDGAIVFPRGFCQSRGQCLPTRLQAISPRFPAARRP